MKATGIVRRIDDLGRVVIPKEIRRTLRIREGDPLEIFTDREGEIILKKYSPIGEIGEYAKQYAESMGTVSNCGVVITDRDQIIAASGTGRKDLLGKRISSSMEEVMEAREVIDTTSHKQPSIALTDSDEYGKTTSQIIYPIISERDITGAVAILEKENGSVIGETERKLAKVAAEFLGKQMEN